MKRSSRREAVEVIRSMSVELSEQLRALLSLPAASGVDRKALERLRGQINDVAGRATQPLRVAFIGEQSTGKSSILNDLLGTHLPQGENGLDRFVTEIVHPEAAPAWIRAGSAAGLQF